MSNNHFLIGLGGTGGRVIRAFRKTIFQEHRDPQILPRFKDSKTGEWSEPRARIGYLYVDTSATELEGNDDEWKVLGKSVKLDEESRLLLREASLETVFNNISSNSNIAPWLGDPEIVKEYLRGSGGTAGANQIRRLGRFLFASRASRFTSKLKAGFAKLVGGSKSAVSFHICCTLAAGTGSGSLIDVISQIREIYKNPTDYPIYIYALVTDTDVGQKDSGGLFYANQYAVLSELNALKLDLFKPHNVDATRTERLGERTKSGDADLWKGAECWKQCFLLSDKNETGTTATPAEQEQMIADYLYQKVVALAGKIPLDLSKAEDMEDKIGTWPGEGTEDGRERSFAFGSFGIKRFQIPEKDIREKLIFAFSEQSALQMLFNNWTDNGFIKKARSRDLPEFVTDPGNNEKWYLTDEHLKLSTDFRLAQGKEWSQLRIDWDTNIAAEKEDIREANSGNKHGWLDLLRQFAKDHFERHYRGRGVINYYDDKRVAKAEYANAIREKIESDLFNRWRTGEDSVSETGQILEVLMDYLGKRKRTLDAEIADQRNLEEEAEKKLDRNEVEWSKRGGIFAMFSLTREADVFNAFAMALTDQYTAMTERIALEFAGELIQQVISELTTLKSKVDKVSASLYKSSENFRRHIERLCPPSETMDLTGKVVRFVEPRTVNRTIEQLVTDEKVQRAHSQSARDRLLEQMGADPNFSAFSNFAEMVLEVSLVGVSDEQSTTAHLNLVNRSNDYKKILGVNVIEKLYEEHGGMTEKLAAQVKSLMENAKTYMRFSGENQPSMKDPTIPKGMPLEATFVFLPKCDHHREFWKQLGEKFKACGGSGDLVVPVEVDHNLNEITIISLRYWFALRFMEPLRVLRSKYERLMSEGANSGIHKVHVENHHAVLDPADELKDFTKLPSLFIPDDSLLAKQALAFKSTVVLPTLILAQHLGLIAPVKDPQSGVMDLVFAERNESGRALTQPIALGAKTELELQERLDRKHLKLIQEAVRRRLDGPAFLHVDRRDELKRRLDASLDTIFVDRGSNDLDKIYLQFFSASEKAKEMVG